MALELGEFLIPLAIIATITLVLTVLGNRSPSTMLGSAALVITILIWSDILDTGYIIISTLMLGVALWLNIFGRRDE